MKKNRVAIFKESYFSFLLFLGNQPFLTLSSCSYTSFIPHREQKPNSAKVALDIMFEINNDKMMKIIAVIAKMIAHFLLPK